jgi:hypothetical protein
MMECLDKALCLWFALLGPALLAAGTSGVEKLTRMPHPGKLTAAQARQIQELEQKALKAGLEGRFGKALALAKEILAFRGKHQGRKHWQVIDARREVESWQRLARTARDNRSQLQRNGNEPQLPG